MFLFQDFCFVIKEKTREMDTETHFKVFFIKNYLSDKGQRGQRGQTGKYQKRFNSSSCLTSSIFDWRTDNFLFAFSFIMWEHVRVSGHFSGVQQRRRRLYSRRWDEVCAQASAWQGWIELKYIFHANLWKGSGGLVSVHCPVHCPATNQLKGLHK